MTETEELEWYRNWRRKVRSAFRLWLNATGYQDGCERLSDLKAVFNERAPEQPQKGDGE